MDDHTQRRLTDLREALFQAISASEEVREVWSELKEQGYSLYLLLENSSLVDEELETRPDTEDVARGPLFQINGADLSFLRSVGIDPTRRSRGGKT